MFVVVCLATAIGAVTAALVVVVLLIVCKGIGGDTECPLQVCQLSRSSESTHFLFLRRDVALFDSTRAPDGFLERRHVPPIYFLTIPNTNRQPSNTKPIQTISNTDKYRPFEAVF